MENGQKASAGDKQGKGPAAEPGVAAARSTGADGGPGAAPPGDGVGSSLAGKAMAEGVEATFDETRLTASDPHLDQYAALLLPGYSIHRRFGEFNLLILAEWGRTFRPQAAG